MGFRRTTQDSKLSSESADELEALIRKAVREFARQTSEQEEPALKVKLNDERRRRESLERQLNDVREDSRRSRQQAELMNRQSQIRESLQDLGVRKVDLALKLVKDDIFRAEDGDLYGDVEGKQTPYLEYLTQFVADNPELLPPRIAGGAGAVGASDGEISSAGFDLDSIRPGMSEEDSVHAWREVARLTGHGSHKW